MVPALKRVYSLLTRSIKDAKTAQKTGSNPLHREPERHQINGCLNQDEEKSRTQPGSGARGELSQRLLSAKETMVTGTACANGQVFMLKVLFYLRKDKLDLRKDKLLIN